MYSNSKDLVMVMFGRPVLVIVFALDVNRTSK